MSGLDEAREAMCIIALRLVREARLPFVVSRTQAGISIAGAGGRVGIVPGGGRFAVISAGERLLRVERFEEALSAAAGMCAARAIGALALDAPQVAA